jgi:4Fe-4S binding domain.
MYKKYIFSISLIKFKNLYRCIDVQKVVILRDSYIACGACIAYCPHSALEPDEEGKPVLMWDLRRDDFPA